MPKKVNHGGAKLLKAAAADVESADNFQVHADRPGIRSVCVGW